MMAVSDPEGAAAADICSNKLSNPSNGAQTTHTTKVAKSWDGAARVYVPVFTSMDSSPEALTVRFQ